MLLMASLRTLSPIVPVELLAAGPDRRSRADVRARSHVGEVGRQRDERPGAGRATAARRDPDDRRNGASSRADTIRWVASRLPPGVLSITMRAGDGASTARIDGFLDVAGHDVVDDPGRGGHVDRGGRITGGRCAGARARVGRADGRRVSEGSRP